MPYTLAGKLVTAVVMTLIVTLTAAMDYPDPLPDFAHPNAPHYSGYQPVNAATSRPILIIRGGFTDLPWPAAKDDAWLGRRFFGGYPSVRDYFVQSSDGRVDFSRARERSGVHDDGVVTVDYGITNAQWDALTDEQKMRHGVNVADPLVDYSVFDRNGDHRLGQDEVVIAVLQPVPFDTGDSIGGNGATRGVFPGPALDGIDLDWRPNIWAQSALNQITLAHEVMHAAFGVGRDFHGYPITGFDLMGGTASGAEWYVELNSWHKMHLGWAKPTVVTRDGYYSVPAWDTSDTAFLLYDPDRGTDDYLLVENRWGRPGTYDVDVRDNGLAVWRIDESQYYNDAPDAYPIRLQGPCPDYACTDHAWDASDPQTPQREMTGPWRDGTPGGVAVRMVYEAGPTTTAYFDVPGPGAAVDCFDRYTESRRREVQVIAGQTVALRLPVQNTAEEAGAIGLGLAEEPGPGWSWSGTTADLGAKETTSGRLLVTTPADAASGSYRLWPEATWLADPRHTSRCDVVVRVVAPPATSWGYASTRALQYDAPVGEEVTLEPNWQWGTWRRDPQQAARHATMVRTATGRYTVTMPGLGSVPGVAHAGAGVSWGYTDAAWCQLRAVTGSGADRRLDVACFDGAGTPKNLPFAVWTSGPSAGPRPQLQIRYETVGGFGNAVPLVNEDTYNSTTGPVSVRRTGEGRYEVTAVGAVFDATGYPRVTALNDVRARCRAASVEDAGAELRIGVECVDAAFQPRSTPWLLTYTEGVGAHHDPSVPAAYASTEGEPSAPAIDSLRSWSSTGEVPTIARTAPGVYDINYQAIGNPYTYPADLVDVTAVGPQVRSCRALSWNSYGAPGKLRIIVHCYDAARRLADAHFAFAYLRAPDRT
ncbi:hypothetical protein Misp01_78930 [Microtetraspora sp. NBRC 13810]|uniref:hypothetical protein n=1 Tax=Microtetraspora sp. NBRC 13810 TaxID=3030990 RepID=UPI0024A33C16|nr:hypothetical protein [Microtetraspora sp. NBRC 13810]GLW12765.1 hypothetical protein Misp01_78930 [Microtetraspora sp. NBRC 13810]